LAHRALARSADLVLGPAADGGYYLIGATRAGARRALFSAIPWSTAGVLRTTFARAIALGLRTRLLPWWYDIDEASDLALLRHHLARLPGTVAPSTRRVLAVVK
jgi:glycosyltransferase A (GT-A) superfamily protein (DUF2064 family)